MFKIPIRPKYPNQTVSFVGSNQQITFRLYLRDNNFYADLYNGDKVVVLGVPVIHKKPLNQYITENNINGYLFAICDNEAQEMTLSDLGITCNFFFSNELKDF
ncbi:phage baseplate plug family protein [Francisella tularensis]|uniref:phage baseplate plug family protein n=1 Tax=Francisella tularensis TaxID=263 RepID=UPI0008F52A17|nr:hypothetical protein [Francisella tularensis]APA83238.1 hypothetical protein N894_1254 [Francisella tularensis subsp. novicida PA10-7858]